MFGQVFYNGASMPCGFANLFEIFTCKEAQELVFYLYTYGT